MGFPVELLLDTDIKPELLCGICRNVLWEPTMLLPCQHVYCKNCIGTGTIRRPMIQQCPLDREIVTPGTVREAPRIYAGLLNKLEVRCIFSVVGCDVKMRLGEYFEHRAKCKHNPNNPEPCDVKDCGALLTQEEKPNHNCVVYWKNRASAKEGVERELGSVRKELRKTKEELRSAQFRVEVLKDELNVKCWRKH